jgi:hypothetical protein
LYNRLQQKKTAPAQGEASLPVYCFKVCFYNKFAEKQENAKAAGKNSFNKNE